jgi:hypothetical protein
MNQDFLADHPEDAPQPHHRCTNLGEVASCMPMERLTPSKVADFYKSFYITLPHSTMIWFPYSSPDVDQFERPYFFKFDKVCDLKYDSTKTFQIAISSCLLPTNFCSGRGKTKLYAYKFYHPSVAARQFTLGQLPVHLFLSDRIQSKDVVTSALEYGRLKSLTDTLICTGPNNWAPAPALLFSTIQLLVV